MNGYFVSISIVFAGFLVSCAASVPPPELVSAREAYQQANTGQAARLAPAELQRAEEALAVAEEAFQEEPNSYRTRDLANVADRKAKLAEALATTVAGDTANIKGDRKNQASPAEIVKKSARQLAIEHRTRIETERRTAEARDNLAILAAVKEDARGLVITLLSSVLFASNTSELLPAAQNRLRWVADALLVTKERKLTIEAYTDAQGPPGHTQELSRERAESVRSFIVSRGYPGDLIRAQGFGQDNAAAGKTSVEGRARHRRVEIIVDREASNPGSLTEELGTKVP